MQKFKLVKVACLMVLSLSLVSFLLTESLNTEVKIINNSDFDIVEILVSAESVEQWIPLDLNDQILKANDSMYVNIELNEECFWDIMVKDKDFNEYVINSIDLCNEKSVSIFIEDNSDEETDEDEN
ncbi:MAG: hypothetical protein JEY94_05695 [Melioribacteraceae bacterium]|nr:hypothetical protein [Melioribacteraceae bacterium]